MFTKPEPIREDELNRMARDFFGYGRWDAPYWFIGPEAGMSSEDSDSHFVNPIKNQSARLLNAALDDGNMALANADRFREFGLL